VALGLPAVDPNLVAELVALHLARLELVLELLDLVLEPAELLELLLVGLDDALKPVVVVQDPEEGAELSLPLFHPPHHPLVRHRRRHAAHPRSSL
jgi:hypothetical protein